MTTLVLLETSVYQELGMVMFWRNVPVSLPGFSEISPEFPLVKVGRVLLLMFTLLNRILKEAAMISFKAAVAPIP